MAPPSGSGARAYRRFGAVAREALDEDIQEELGHAQLVEGFLTECEADAIV